MASVEWAFVKLATIVGFTALDRRIPLYRLISAGYESNGTLAARVRAMINEVYIDLRKLDSDNS
jgi:hypothetical protein